jgi:hypothetical protein
MVNALLGKLCDIFNVLIRITDGKVKCIGDVRCGMSDSQNWLNWLNRLNRFDPSPKKSFRKFLRPVIKDNQLCWPRSPPYEFVLTGQGTSSAKHPHYKTKELDP